MLPELFQSLSRQSLPSRGEATNFGSRVAFILAQHTYHTQGKMPVRQTHFMENASTFFMNRLCWSRCDGRCRDAGAAEELLDSLDFSLHLQNAPENTSTLWGRSRQC